MSREGKVKRKNMCMENKERKNRKVKKNMCMRK
jgi:hypothetical protein